MKLMKSKFIFLTAIFGLIIFHMGRASAEITPDIPDITPPDHQLYIDNISQINNMQTVTYFFTEKNITTDAKNKFKKFAENLGLNNGAIVVNKNGEKYLQYSKIMNCDINTTPSDLIVFENRKITKKNKGCVYFNVDDLKNINQLLAIVNKYKADISTMKEYGDKVKAREIVKKSCLASELCKPYVNTVDTLVDIVLETTINKN